MDQPPGARPSFGTHRASLAQRAFVLPRSRRLLPRHHHIYGEIGSGSATWRDFGELFARRAHEAERRRRRSELGLVQIRRVQPDRSSLASGDQDAAVEEQSGGVRQATDGHPFSGPGGAANQVHQLGRG